MGWLSHGLLRLGWYATLLVFGAASLRFVPPGVYALKWVMLAGLAALLVAASARTGLRSAGLPVVLVFLPWFVLALGAQIVIGVTDRGLGLAGGHLGLIILSFLLLPSAFPSLDDADRLERWAVHGLAVVCLISIALALRDLPGAVVPGSDRFRVRWGFQHVNTGGYVGYLGTALALRQCLAGRIRFLLPLGLFVLVVATSSSRGAYLALAVALAVTGAILLVRRRGGALAIAALVGAALLVAGLVLPLVPAGSWDRYLADLNAVSTGRWRAWTLSLGQLNTAAEWLVGRGAGQSQSFIGTRASVGGSSDSLIIDLIARTGLVGLGIWFATVLVIGIVLGRALRSTVPGSAGAGQAAFACGLAASAVASATFEGFVFSVGSTYAVVAWGIVGVTAGALLGPRAERRSDVPQPV